MISWEDPQGTISGSTLAVGGGVASGSTGTVNGTVFNRFIRGYILFQNAADLSASFRQSLNFSRVVEHEIGHTIGLGHTQTDGSVANPTSNIMLASCCSGATPVPPAIGQDDLDAVTFIYPSGIAPPPPAGCSYTVSPTAASAPQGGGSGSVSVTTTAGCPWSAASNNTSVVTITSGSSGTGSGTVTYTVVANTTSTQRTATLTVAGQTVTITQPGVTGPTCNYVVSPTAVSVGVAGSSGSVSVSVAAGCTWTAVSNATFTTITAGASGSGVGTVSYTVAANSALSQRSGTMTIAGQTVTVTQDGTGPFMSLDRTSLNFGATTSGGTFTSQTSAQTVRLSQIGAGTVTWTAAPPGRATVSPTSGTGPATLDRRQPNASVLEAALLFRSVTLSFTDAGLPDRSRRLPDVPNGIHGAVRRHRYASEQRAASTDRSP